MFNKLILGVLAVQGTSAVALGDKTRAATSHSAKDIEWTLKNLDEKVGDIKYVRPHDVEHFDLSDILGDFYDQVDFKYGDRDYGTFNHHGAFYKYGIKPVEVELHDWDFGLEEHGTPENLHNHFNYDAGEKTKSFWNPFPTLESNGDHSVHIGEKNYGDAAPQHHGYAPAPRPKF